MIANVVVGLIFAGIMLFALKKVFEDVKDNKCSCGSSCSDKSKCGKH